MNGRGAGAWPAALRLLRRALRLPPREEANNAGSHEHKRRRLGSADQRAIVLVVVIVENPVAVMGIREQHEKRHGGYVHFAVERESKPGKGDAGRDVRSTRDQGERIDKRRTDDAVPVGGVGVAQVVRTE